MNVMTAMNTISRRAAWHDPVGGATYDGLLDLSNNRFGKSDAPCPFCGPSKRAPANRKRRVLRIWSKPGFASYYCARCEAKGWALDKAVHGRGQCNEWQAPSGRDQVDPEDVHHQRQIGRARWLWRHREPIECSPAEIYLRDVRQCDCEFPATFGFLPPLKQGHHPALISGFGIPHEPKQGMLELADLNLRGVHLIRLKPAGSGKAEVQPNKIFVGPSKGWPIVIAPPTDLLGLAITEGIEDALSVHEATGLGVWASGAANRMPALAALIPAYIECVTVYAHDDEVGQRSARALGDALFARGIEVFVEGLL